MRSVSPFSPSPTAWDVLDVLPIVKYTSDALSRVCYVVPSSSFDSHYVLLPGYCSCMSFKGSAVKAEATGVQPVCKHLLAVYMAEVVEELARREGIVDKIVTVKEVDEIGE